MANTDLVFKMYDSFAKGDMDAIRNDLFDPDIVWRMPGRHPLSGEMKGVDAVLSFFGALFQAGITVTDAHFGELDDGTVIEKHLGHGTANGKDYFFPTSTSYGIRDGKIYDVQVHTAAQPDVDNYMWSRFPLKTIPERLAN